MSVPTSSAWTHAAAILSLGVLLAGCGEEAKTSPPRALTSVPADGALAQIYDSSCKLCHANPGAGAPLTGDANAWAPRVAQGSDTLLDHTINGYNGMPPMGLCMHCSEEQFLALIGFMSGQPLQ
ncbi:cytochrome c5 family protein [Pseudomonas sp. Fig-3]|jgi:cytochrome c5|uniref:Cytochrome c5 family protein n=1 Tax=Pseudomonas rhizophila TaxID=2045200 RepID=A0ABN5JYF3_9PSED|nr:MULTISPECIES: c-type cytochrome [Pseudomonas]AVU77208.1 cytochrome c5 family protein [Pseudomonas rhizophila]MBD0702371.1 cytochrome c5 family protein [Pseudomonas sp. PSB1]MDD2033789.1 c-type cytochrome [Pseudomonas sp. 39167]MDR8386013.1 c-type cytochrome [Pseudomonas sp. JL2]MEA1028171.1 c-type cytochrome [Pseudomonas sp. N-137]